MKVIINEASRANQKLVPDEVTPIEGYYIPDVMRVISDGYG